MGVPAFFIWLVKKYPKVLQDAVEQETIEIDGVEVPIDTSQPNPNGLEYDAMYLDMNGIIHPCTHPEDRPAPTTEDEMMLEIFRYIDRIFAIVRPRKLIHMAIDGVAPRAKLNQQRARRFKSAQEAVDKEEADVKLRIEWEKQGMNLPPKKAAWFDSNVITPGTQFMERVATALHFYTKERLTNDPGWRNVKVVISDSNVPGEGEHKVMDFIRRQRAQPGYDPNFRHVMVGLDADLIMLGLGTHEAHFSILREQMISSHDRKCHICNQSGHIANNCPGIAREKRGEFDEMATASVSDPNKKMQKGKPHQFLNIETLREYLKFDLQVSAPTSFPFSIEAAIDDFVFMCFLVGNDFLPNLPSLDIRNGALDELMTLYRRVLPLLDGHLTSGATVHLPRVAKFFRELESIEDRLFKSRIRYERRISSQGGGNASRKSQDVIGGRDMRRSLQKHEEAAKERRDRQFAEKKTLELEREKAALERRLSKTNSKVSTGVVVDASANVSAAKLMRAKLLGLESEVEQHDVKPSGDAALGFVNTESNVSDLIANESPDRLEKRGVKRKLDSINPDDMVDDDSGFNDVVSDVAPVVNGADGGGNDSDSCDDVVEAIAEADATMEIEVKFASNEDFQEKLADSLKQTNDEQAALLMENDCYKYIESPDFKQRYYRQKFGVTDDQIPVLQQKLCQSYIEGLCWVMKYYYDGVPSWTWYYPFHYAPFSSDLVGFEKNPSPVFIKGKPFSPFEQLLGVMPASSGKRCLPDAYARLMYDSASPVLDFYPKTFEQDINGKRFMWQAVVLLPFINEKRLFSALKEWRAEEQLTEEERKRNSQGSEFLYLRGSHPAASMILALQRSAEASVADCENKLSVESGDETEKVSYELPIIRETSVVDISARSMALIPKVFENMFGSFSPYLNSARPGQYVRSPIDGMADLQYLNAVSCLYKLPLLLNHVCALLAGIYPSKPLLTEQDYQQMRERQHRDLQKSQSHSNAYGSSMHQNMQMGYLSWPPRPPSSPMNAYAQPPAPPAYPPPQFSPYCNVPRNIRPPPPSHPLYPPFGPYGSRPPPTNYPDYAGNRMSMTSANVSPYVGVVPGASYNEGRGQYNYGSTSNYHTGSAPTYNHGSGSAYNYGVAAGANRPVVSGSHAYGGGGGYSSSPSGLQQHYNYYPPPPPTHTRWVESEVNGNVDSSTRNSVNALPASVDDFEIPPPTHVSSFSSDSSQDRRRIVRKPATLEVVALKRSQPKYH